MSSKSSFRYFENVKARLDMLLEARRDPSNASQFLIEACSSQSALAALSIPKKGISPLARNSLYKYADLVIMDFFIPEGNKDAGKSGHKYLDWLRNEVRKIGKANGNNRSKKAREERLKDRASMLTAEMDLVRRHSLAISKAYLHLMVALKSLYTQENLDELTRQRLINVINDHDRLYSGLFEEVGSVRPANLEFL